MVDWFLFWLGPSLLGLDAVAAVLLLVEEALEVIALLLLLCFVGETALERFFINVSCSVANRFLIDEYKLFRNLLNLN